MLIEGYSIRRLSFNCLHRVVTNRNWPVATCKACALQFDEYLLLDVPLCNSHDPPFVPKAMQRPSSLNKATRHCTEWHVCGQYHRSALRRFTLVCNYDKKQRCMTHWGTALSSSSCSLVSLGSLVILHLLPETVHLALQHVEAGVNVGGDADCTADVSMAGLHLLLQKAHVISQHLNMPAQQCVAVMRITFCMRLAVSSCRMTNTSFNIVIILGLSLQPRHFWTACTACSMGRWCQNW